MLNNLESRKKINRTIYDRKMTNYKFVRKAFPNWELFFDLAGWSKWEEIIDRHQWIHFLYVRCVALVVIFAFNFSDWQLRKLPKTTKNLNTIKLVARRAAEHFYWENKISSHIIKESGWTWSKIFSHMDVFVRIWNEVAVRK